MSNYTEGIIDQIYTDEGIIVISVDKGSQRITVKITECEEGVLPGDFVLYDKCWYKNPNNDSLKKELNDLIKSLYKENLKK